MRLILSVVSLFLVGSVAAPANLLENGGFEHPEVSVRTPESDGADSLIAGDHSSWEIFGYDDGPGGKLEIGITNAIARSGKQSIYIDFQKVTDPGRMALLRTKPLPVKAGQQYRFSIWGRVDHQRPLALDERRVHMWLTVEYFAADGVTAVGEPFRGPQLIPGLVIPGGPHQLIFVSTRWSETFGISTAPANAALARVTCTWATPRDEGETDGIIYWDDAALIEYASTPASIDAPRPTPKPRPEKFLKLEPDP